MKLLEPRSCLNSYQMMKNFVVLLAAVVFVAKAGPAMVRPMAFSKGNNAGRIVTDCGECNNNMSLICYI